MILSDLQTEFQARGFDYLSTTRQNYYLNRAYADTCEDEDWPFLEATNTAVMPQTITDLRTVASVIDTTQLVKLSPLDIRNITDTDATMVTTGVPAWYYITGGTTVNVYPANVADSFTVRYWKVPTALSAAGDTPLLPTRFQLLLVDAACAFAYFDSDNFEAAREMIGLWEMGKERMRQSLLVQQHDQPDDFIIANNMDPW